MRETWVWSLGWEYPREKEMATHFSILAWRIPMDRVAWWAAVHRVAELDTAELISISTNIMNKVEFFFLILLCRAACGISVPCPVIEPGPLQWKHQILYYQGTHQRVIFNILIFLKYFGKVSSSFSLYPELPHLLRIVIHLIEEMGKLSITGTHYIQRWAWKVIGQLFLSCVRWP